MLDLVAQIPSGLDSQTLAAGERVAAEVAQHLGASEWLGPLAPIALSPFFGLAALSGIACFGPDWLQERSGLFAASSPLNNPFLFWTMASLAIMTSVPRFTKVSKPLALVAEKLESYSAIVILIVVRLAGSYGSDPSNPAAWNADPVATVWVTASIASLPLDICMALLAAINVIMINTVKLFFEALIWLTPVPFIDAALEVGNKSLCAVLLGLYCYSPWLAAAVDLLLLGLAALAFGWVYRRLQCFLDLIVGPWLSRLMPAWFAQRHPQFDAYLATPSNGLPRYTRVVVKSLAPNSFEVQAVHLWRRASWTANLRSREEGLIFQKVELATEQGELIALWHRRWSLYDANCEKRTPATAG